MKKKLFVLWVLTIGLAIVLTNPLGAQDKEKRIKKSFPKKETVVIKTVSGDCIVKTGTKSEIQVLVMYTYSEEIFKPEFLEEGGTLVLKEKFKKNSRASGRSEWVLTVPKETKITFATASGDFSIAGTSGGLKAGTASGDIEANKIKGEVKISTASGDIVLKEISGEVKVGTASGDLDLDSMSGNVKIGTASGDIRGKNLYGNVTIKTASGDVECDTVKGEEVVIKTASGEITLHNGKGAFKLKTASGEIEAMAIEVTGESHFGTASGEVKVKLAKTSKYDMTLSSASGDVELFYNGNPVVGYFEFVAKKDRGKIVSPIKFDKQEEFVKYGQLYMRKSFKKQKSTPKIILKTASGKAKLVK